jgi:hypothetical protein
LGGSHLEVVELYPELVFMNKNEIPVFSVLISLGNLYIYHLCNVWVGKHVYLLNTKVSATVMFMIPTLES